jgi:hypothetical protein
MPRKECGAKEVFMFCMYCGKQLPEGKDKCPNCFEQTLTGESEKETGPDIMPLSDVKDREKEALAERTLREVYNSKKN